MRARLKRKKTALLLLNVNTSTLTRPNIYLSPLFIPLFSLPFTLQCHTPADGYHVPAISISWLNIRSPQCFGLCFNGCVCVSELSTGVSHLKYTKDTLMNTYLVFIFIFKITKPTHTHHLTHTLAPCTQKHFRAF